MSYRHRQRKKAIKRRTWNFVEYTKRYLEQGRWIFKIEESHE